VSALNKIRTTLLLVILSLSAAPSSAALPVPAAPDIAARSYVLQDFSSGRIFAERNADERMEPASITKLMTAYAVFHELRAGDIKLEAAVTISERAWKMGGSRMFIEVNKQASVEELLQGMIVQSGNDASVALAEHVAGSEEAFAALMNEYAAKLGMKNSHFMNSTGWPDPEHYTTARDIAILAHAIIDEFPEYYKWYSQREFTYNGITQGNRNTLLWRDASVDGMKTGHTDAAGFCLVTSAKRDDMRLITVVLGTSSEKIRADESLSLLNYGFRFFETHKLYTAGQQVTEAKIWKGAVDRLPLGLAHDLYITVPRGQYKNLKAELKLNAVLTAPATQGEPYGAVGISLADEVITEQPLIALQDVPEGSLFKQLLDELYMLWE
jgi:D-alanyl-D-alanine carboxypeptidase (penicillin-binding protein 5/6)